MLSVILIYGSFVINECVGWFFFFILHLEDPTESWMFISLQMLLHIILHQCVLFYAYILHLATMGTVYILGLVWYDQPLLWLSYLFWLYSITQSPHAITWALPFPASGRIFLSANPCYLWYIPSMDLSILFWRHVHYIHSTFHLPACIMTRNVASFFFCERTHMLSRVLL